MLGEKCALDGRRSCSRWVRQPSLLKAVAHAYLRVWPTSISVQVTSARWTLCCVWAATASLATRRNIWPKQQNCWSSCWTTRPCSQQKPVTRADTSVSWYTHTHTPARTLFSFIRVPSDLWPPLSYALLLRNDWCRWTVPKSLSGSLKKNIPRKDKKRIRNRG